ncbi:hypothetical protein FRC16_004900 [Serendipita sp. 398]|nr:hypothetical protein FRC16_004900 [Serendipita sp. 398]
MSPSGAFECFSPVVALQSTSVFDGVSYRSSSKYHPPVDAVGCIALNQPRRPKKRMEPILNDEITRRRSGINRLPPEILGDIFMAYLRHAHAGPVERLMAVCSTWKTVCMGTPILWTKMVVNLSHWGPSLDLREKRRSYIHHHLVRSGVLSMDVTIHLTSHPSIDPRACVHLSQDVLELLFSGGWSGKGSGNWHALSVSFDESTPRRLLDFLGRDLGRVKSLTMDAPRDARVPVMSLPSLCHLERKDGVIPGGFDASQLDSLTLHSIRLTPEEANLLSNYTHLTTLVLHRPISSSPLMKKVTLSRLTTLDVRTPLAVGLRFLVLPQLHTLRTVFEDASVQSVCGLRQLNQVRGLEFTELEWTVSLWKNTGLGFAASYAQDMTALRVRPSMEILQRLLVSCPELEVVTGLDMAVTRSSTIVKMTPSNWPRLSFV